MAEGLWFPVYLTMARHPKTLKLARLMKLKRREALGLLVDLFSWAVQSADRDGVFADCTAEDIAEALDYPRKSRVVSVLVEAGWLEQSDDRYALHDWAEYTGSLYASREKNREKNKRYRDRKKEAALPPRDGHDTVTETDSETGSLPASAVAVTGQHVHSQEQRDLTTTTTISAGARDENLGRVMTAFLDKINPIPSQTSLDELKGCVGRMGAEVCLRAIDRALDAGAEKANWNYIRAILRSLSQRGVKCLADWDRLEEERERRKHGEAEHTGGAGGQDAGWNLSGVTEL